MAIFRIILFSCLILIVCSAARAQTDSAIISTFFAEALRYDQAYSDLHDLCKDAGPRLSGSGTAARAVVVIRTMLQRIGLDSVWLQEVQVPHWVRGERETASLISPALGRQDSIAICALGGSIATPEAGIHAQVIEVSGLGQLKNIPRDSISGKIVFYNGAFDQTFTETFRAYGKAVPQRHLGAIEAAYFGASGMLVRSMAQHIDNWPHTGAMAYSDSVKKIPAAAVSTSAAEEIHALLGIDKRTEISFKTHCQTMPDVRSYNVIGEIKGSELPNEVILVGGHLDSWDLAEGAQDDGAGVVQAMEVLRLFRRTGMKPKRTIRMVAFMNEENGGRGGARYAEWARQSGQAHLAAIESDAGGFTPRGFSLDVNDTLRHYVVGHWKGLLDKFEIGDLDNEGSGADVDHLKGYAKLLGELHPDSQRYFDFHHTARDTWENVNDRELEMGAASMAAFVYLIDKYGLQNR